MTKAGKSNIYNSINLSFNELEVVSMGHGSPYGAYGSSRKIPNFDTCIGARASMLPVTHLLGAGGGGGSVFDTYQRRKARMKWAWLAGHCPHSSIACAQRTSPGLHCLPLLLHNGHRSAVSCTFRGLGKGVNATVFLPLSLGRQAIRLNAFFEYVRYYKSYCFCTITECNYFITRIPPF